MIEGSVNRQLEPTVTLTVGNSPGHEHQIDAVVDTGYSGQLTLPNHVIAGFGLQRVGVSQATLADGSTINFNVYGATLQWSGKEVDIAVDEVHSVPLVGMSLLEGSTLQIDVRHYGRVLIKP